MLKEIRKIRSKEKRNKIWNAIARKRINKYINLKGYVCYDSKELENYLKSAKRGRPAKMLDKGE